MKYLAGTLRDAAAEGSVEVKDAVELARAVFCYIAGLIMQAKIENNPAILKDLKKGVLRLLGTQPLAPVSSAV